MHLGRWMKTLGRPNTLLDKVKDVQDTIVGMRHLCDELLDKEVNLIKQNNLGKSRRALQTPDEC